LHEGEGFYSGAVTPRLHCWVAALPAFIGMAKAVSFF
jgi:hypothetical protein